MKPSEKIKCLDQGYVQLVDVMGDDDSIVDAARVSIAGENVRAVSENRGLIRYLMRHRHTTPLEMVEFKFRCKMPIFVARQWIRHRTANVNEMSGRYAEMPKEYYVPALEDIQPQASKNKQGRSEEAMDNPEIWRDGFAEEAKVSFDLYQDRIDAGMARELARANLPLSTYTQWIWKIDLHNLLHFLALRLHPHAQKEIRVFGEAMASLIKPIVPIAYEAFEDYRLNGCFLSANDVLALQAFIAAPYANTDAMLAEAAKHFPTKREHSEFVDKYHAVLKPREWVTGE
jgi:thymidylate synthase (FAD)